MRALPTLVLAFSSCLMLTAQENGGPYAPDANTVLLMHFDGNATNSAIAGNNGIVHGSGVSYASGGVHGQCLRLDNSTAGKQSWIEVPHYNELNFTEEFSIECWFKINSWGESQTGSRELLKKEGTSGDTDYEVTINAADHSYRVKLDCIDEGSVTWSSATRSPEIFELNKWYFVSFYYNHAHKSFYSLIRDENFQEIYAVPGYSETPPVNSQGKLMIGFGGWSESFFDGWIDELRICNNYRKYRDDVVKDIDVSTFKNDVMLELKDKWTVYQWPLGTYYPLNKETGIQDNANSCGPTMLMRTIHYWEHPRFPSGVTEFEMFNADYYADFDHTEYRWDLFPETFHPGITEAEYGPAATFSAQVGTASMQSFDHMFSMPKFLKENFHFSNKTRVIFEDEYTAEEWENIIKNELNNGRPVMAGGVNSRGATGGSGHYYIISGYNSDNEFFTDFSFNDVYWKKLSEFDYGIAQNIIIYMEPDFEGKSLILNSPDGGDVCRLDSEMEIRWTSENISKLILEYSPDAGKNWNTIAENIDAGSGSFNWIIAGTHSNEYKIRISDEDDLNINRKTKSFEVYDHKEFVFEYPKLHTEFKKGTLQPVYWASAGIKTIKLEYSVDDQNWMLLMGSADARPGLLNVMFPNIVANEIQIRATEPTDLSNVYYSETFSLVDDRDWGGPHKSDDKTLLLMHFENNISNEAGNRLLPFETNPIGAYLDNYSNDLGRSFRLFNPDYSTADAILVKNSENIDLGNNWTIEAWVKIESIMGDRTVASIIVDKWDAFNINAGWQHFGGYVNFGNGTRVEFTDPDPYQLGQWYHVALISDSFTETINFFVHDENRNLIFDVSRDFPVGSNGIIKQNENLLKIGGLGGASNLELDGTLDEIRIIKSSTLVDYLELMELPFSDNFEEIISSDATFTNWTTQNLEGWNYWHIIPWNGNPGQCMRFENTDIDQNDWLITKPIRTSGVDGLNISFDNYHNRDGVKPRLLYKILYENGNASDWIELQYSLGENENEWHNTGDLVIDELGDAIYFAFHYEASPDNAIFFLLDNFSVEGVVADPRLINVSVILESSYNISSGLMSTTLNSLLPLAQPYHADPWNYTGTEQVASIPAGIVDWVLVELREASDPAAATSGTIVATFAAFLKSNGSIVDLDGISLPDIGNLTVTNNLYVVIRHRNHLDIMSATGATLSGNIYTYNFTTDLSQAYGGAVGYKTAGSIAVMVAGDIDLDGSVFVSDYNRWAAGFGSMGGYYYPDLDMDGSVFVSDYNKWASNFGSTFGGGFKSSITKPKYFSCVPK